MPKRMINQDHLPLKRQFIRQLRDEYNAGTELVDCWYMYIGFIKVFLQKTGQPLYLVEATDWQREDFEIALTHYKTMWHRTRRGGKSLGLSLIAVFFSLIRFGYKSTKGRVVWRAPYTDQLEQAQDWLRQNPFVVHISYDNEVEILNSESLDMACISSGKVASKGVAVLIMDEYKKVIKGHKMYATALEAYGMLAEGPNEYKRMISASTGERLTLFHDQYLSNDWAYCKHDYHECDWITDEFVESERKSNPDDPWYVDQEYECVWVARGGSAFDNVYIVDMVEKTVEHNGEIWTFGDHPFFPLHFSFPTPRKAGVDFNESAGHYIVVGSEDDEAIYANFERVVSTIPELKAYGDRYHMEIESGPFKMNIECAKECHRLHIKCIHKNWDDKVLRRRLRHLRSKMVIIDKRAAPFTLQNIQAAVWDEKSRESKLKKQPDQHGLDALMHMIHRRFNKHQILTPKEKNFLNRSQTKIVRG